jgi:thiosulfate/3-mercaptopyruvate sulfurtransferase
VIAHPVVQPAAFRARVDQRRLATAEWIRERLGSRQLILLDARTPAEFAGQDVRAARGGHIPGAVNIPWTLHLRDDGTFKPEATLRQMYTAIGLRSDDEAVGYCQTGVRGSHVYFVLRLLGYSRVRLYDGSWEEWGNRQELPLETGRGR